MLKLEWYYAIVKSSWEIDKSVNYCKEKKYDLKERIIMNDINKKKKFSYKLKLHLRIWIHHQMSVESILMRIKTEIQNISH